MTKLCSVLLVSACLPLWAADLKPEAILAKHLDSIGNPQARSGAKSRVIEGSATYRLLVGGSGAIDGKAIVASQGQKSNILFKINTNEYRGEQFIFDGDKTSVAGTYSDKSRSELGEFVRGQDVLIREGLLGGVWSTGWPLLDVEERKAKLSYEGTKKIDGRDLAVMRYKPKKGTDLDITLYFDPQTYQHVMTSYKMAIAAQIADSDIETAHAQPTRYRIEERFSDFHSSDGLTLPSHYDLRYTEEMPNGFTKSVEWDVRATRILNNMSLDERNFQAK